MASSRTTIHAGLLSGGGAMLWTLFEYAMGWHNEQIETGAMTGFGAIIFPIIAIVWALKAARREAGGVLTVNRALVTGLMVCAISAAIGVVFFAAYYNIINPEFVAAMSARGQDVDVTTQLVAVVAGSFVVGLLITLVATLVMRRGGPSR